MKARSKVFNVSRGNITTIALSAAIALAGLVFCTARAASTPYLPLNVHVGEKAPDFALLSADGQLVKLSQFAGKNVLLNFYEGYW